MLSNPEKLWNNSNIQFLSSVFGFSQPNDLILPASLLFGSAAVFASIIRLANLYLNGRLAAAIGSDLSCQAYQRTLYQPYEVHIQRNSSNVITNVTTQISLTVSALEAVLQLMTSAVIVVGLLVGLCLVNIKIAFSSISMFGIFYVVLSLTARKKLRNNGRIIASAISYQLQTLHEGLGAYVM